jgi:hypothetical protein
VLAIFRKQTQHPVNLMAHILRMVPNAHANMKFGELLDLLDDDIREDHEAEEIVAYAQGLIGRTKASVLPQLMKDASSGQD